MLHILWMIFKFILLLLGIILGLLLLTLLLVLFCPVRYRVSAVKPEGGWELAKGEGTVSWLFHLISLRAGWQEQKLEFTFCLFGVPVDRLLKKCRVRQENVQKKNRYQDRETGKKTQDNRTVQKKEVKKEAKKSGTDKGKTAAAEVSRPGLDDQETQKTKKVQQSENTVRQKQFPGRKIHDRIVNVVKSIRSGVCKIRRTFGRIRNQASWWRAFLEHPRVKAAGILVWKHAKFLLKHVFPTRIKGQVTFSFEDPALTGMVLAVLGMTIPFHKNRIQINPQFGGINCLQGDISARGRIYGFVFARAALIIYFDKNIKYVIKRWKTRRA